MCATSNSCRDWILLYPIVVACSLLTGFSQVVIDGDPSDWSQIGQGGGAVTPVEVVDDKDLPDTSGDIRAISLTAEDGHLVLTMAVDGIFAPAPEETPADKTNRYYYHWLLDTDNNPATGVNNSTYEEKPTGVQDTIGTEIVIQFGWRNGETDGVYAYDPLNPDEEALISDYEWSKEGEAITARVPYEALNLKEGQLVSVSAFQEGASDGWLTDWMESAEFRLPAAGGGNDTVEVSVEDDKDLPDTSGDIRRIDAAVDGETLILTMAVDGIFAPAPEETPADKTNRYYYHWLLDTDNNPATGVNNSTYEEKPTGVDTPLGTEVVIQFGWRNGETDGVYAYNPLSPDEDPIISDYEWNKEGDSITARIPLSAFGLESGQTVRLSAFQEGASDGWLTDWMESVELKIPASQATPSVSVEDASDLPDTSGDIRQIEARVDGDDLELKMAVQGIFAPAPDETPEGKTNRYYYHWLIDTDDNPATGVNNSTYEEKPTGVTEALGTEIVVQFGWRNGETDGVYAYDPLNPDEDPIISDYEWTKDGDTITARVPLDALDLKAGQTIRLSAFQEGASDGWLTDWMESISLKIPSAGGGSVPIAEVNDPVDDLPDPSGDIQQIQVATDGEFLYLAMTTEGPITPTPEQTAEGKTNRYYYHWLVDADNNPATGVSNGTYEENPTGVQDVIGTEIVIQIGWRDGAPDGVFAYDPTTEDALISDYEWAANGNTFEAKIPLEALGLKVGQKVKVSAFQEGASDGWLIDWIEAAELTLSLPSSGGGADLAERVSANGYGYEATLVDADGAEVDPAVIKVFADDVEVPHTATKENGTTTVVGQFPEWLPANSSHRLRLEYGVGTTDVPFDVPDYQVIPGYYGVKSVEGISRGFKANFTQISDNQTETTSAHGNNPEIAEAQVRGELSDSNGRPYYNEISEDKDRWQPVWMDIDGIINWAENAPAEAGYFNESATGQEDQSIPGINGVANGLAIEVLAYLELEAGFHTLGVNGIGGYKASMGPDGSDRLAPVLGSDNEARRYSFLGDRYFSVLVPESGFYPIRVLFLHDTQTKEGASMELFSFKGTRRIAINDPDDPDAIKAYQFTSGQVPYVSEINPIPGTHQAKPNDQLRFRIQHGEGVTSVNSIELKFDGIMVNPSITRVGEATTVVWHPGALELGSTHEVEFAYITETDPPVERREVYQFGVFDEAAILLPEWSTPVSAASERGFRVRTVQSVGARGNSVSSAEAQLASAGDFTATKSLETINIGGGGIVQEDTDWTGEELVIQDNVNYFSMESIAYLHLTPGLHTLGINSDDGFQLTVGPTAEDQQIVLGNWDSGRGIEDDGPQDLFDVIVHQEGVYAFRLVYFQGTGGASVEWYSYNRQTGQAIALNDEASIPAYQLRGAEPMAIPGPNIQVLDTVDLGAISVSTAELQSGLFVRNTGNANSLTLSNVQVTGPDQDHFTVTESPDTIAPGSSGLVRITFQPKQTPGSFRANLEITSNDSDEGDEVRTVELLAGAVDPLGPLAHYRLDEASGPDLLDASGNGRRGFFEANGGTLQWNQDGLAGGTSVGFSGGSYAQVAGGHFDRWDSFSIAVWVNMADISGSQMLFGKSDPDGSNPTFALLVTEGTLQWFLQEAPEFGTAEPVIQANTTHHVVVTYVNSPVWKKEIFIYVDGEAVASMTDQEFIASGTNEDLFLASLRGPVPLNGRLDDVQIYGRPLTADDVASLRANPGDPLATIFNGGGDPSSSAPVITEVGWTPNGITFQFPGADGKTYQLQYSTTLLPGSWETIQASQGAGAVINFEESEAARQGQPSGYYRVAED